ncbi:MAG: DNA translocase FtsK [Chloroflexi bacterium]|nr:DNA translocase FtsK [Chloroflexota bacterium]
MPEAQGIKIKQRPPRPNPLTEPEWIERIQEKVPQFADELGAFLLISLGLLSFFSLLSPSTGYGNVWAESMRWTFGVGAFVVAAVILGAGGLLLAPKIGQEVKINWWRVITGEIWFVFSLAYNHAMIRASGGEVEALARAIEGRGGGMVGWAVQDALHLLLGNVVTGIVILTIAIVSGLLTLGTKKRHILNALAQTHNRLMRIAMRLDGVDPDSVPATQAAFAGFNNLAPTPSNFDVAAEKATLAGTSSANVQTTPGRSAAAFTSTAPAASEAKAATPSTAPADADSLAPAQRPSIVTGGAPTPADAILTSRLEENEEEKDLEDRFQLDKLVDVKKIRERGAELPPLDLLEVITFERPENEEINRNALIIEQMIAEFGMEVEVSGVKAGPTVTQYAVQPFSEVERDGKKVVQRVRVGKVASLSQDLAVALAASRVRIQAPAPGTTYIGVEVPNKRPGVVSLRPVMESEQFYKVSESALAIALGRQVDGTPFAADLTKMPHLLIGGTTGSGKSVAISSIATCLISNNTPDRLKLVLIDPKMVELIRFNGLPHLLGRVEVELDRIIGVLRWLTREMDRRYKLMEDSQSRNIAIYNERRGDAPLMPYIVVIIDELAELMTEYPDDTEHLITRLAQMARATGIHLVVATQRPSTDIVTGLIKANFPARIAFAVPSSTDSRVIIDSVGAEELIGKGDMLYQASDAAGPIRVQGCMVRDVEIERVVDFWRDNWEQDEDQMPPWERALARRAIIENTDPMIEEAIKVVQAEQEASASQLQRRLGVGYPRAGRLIDALAQLGVVGPDLGGGKPREVLITKDADPDSVLLNQQVKS